MKKELVEEVVQWKNPGNIDLRSLVIPFHPLSDFGEIV
jgi:hypothetical protein